MDKARFQDWLDRYVAAWRSYDPEAIGDLFSEDATYAYHPGAEPVRGRATIVADWLRSPDAPGSWAATYRAEACDDGTCIATGETHYFGPDGTTVVRHYYNIWICRFDDGGRCREFIEYFMTPRKGSS